MENRTRKVVKPLLVILGIAALLSCVQAQEVEGAAMAGAFGASAEPLDDSFDDFALPEAPLLVARALPWKYAKNLDSPPLLIARALPWPYAQNLGSAQVLVLREPSPGIDLPVAAIVKAMDAFRRKLAFSWVKPQGEYLNTMLKEIEAAEISGDTETYNRLATTYSVWASKALLRGKPRMLTDSSP